MKHPNFAKNLQTALTHKGWYGINLCAALIDRGMSVDMQSVNRWLAGTNLPRTDRLSMIAEVLGVSVDLLLKK